MDGNLLLSLIFLFRALSFATRNNTTFEYLSFVTISTLKWAVGKLLTKILESAQLYTDFEFSISRLLP